MTASRSAQRQQLIDLFSAGRVHDAELEARGLVARDPDFGFAWMALGIALQMQGGDALPMLRRAVELMPDDAEAHNNLGNALKDRGQLDDALRHYQRAVALNPDFPEAHHQLGIALKSLGRLEEAAQCYRRALALRPDYAYAHGNLGNALRELGRLEEAIASHQRAVELEPDSAEAHSNLGIALNDVGRLRDAENCHRRALALDPEYAAAHSNLGVALGDLGRLEEAVSSHRRALQLQPDFAAGELNLGNALKDLGRMEEALACYRRALALKPDYTQAHSNLLFAMGFLQDQPPLALREEAERFGRSVARGCRPYTDWPALADRDPLRPLNVGLVSGDLRNHPVGFFIEGVVAALAGSDIRLAAYQTYARADEVTARLKARIPRWTPVMGLDDAALAERIRADGIDILIDLAGHTAYNRLPAFAWKPAPVQVSWLGYFATTGIPGMDYLLADPWSAPPADAAHFSEEVWRLPETRQCFTPPDAPVEVRPPPSLAAGQVTFGSFNQLAKVNDAVLAAWARVLQAAPGARLFLKANQLNDPAAQSGLRARFAARGVDVSRLLFEGFSSRAEYLAAYHRVDVALDTFPYPGGTTTVEAMWMGVPVLALKGDRMLARQGEGLLVNAGMKDWIAADVGDYIERAARRAADSAALSELRMGLRAQLLASPLLDAPRFARHLAAALRGMWQQRCSRP